MSEILKHYGVKGMKWGSFKGVEKTRRTLEAPTLNRSKAEVTPGVQSGIHTITAKLPVRKKLSELPKPKPEAKAVLNTILLKRSYVSYKSAKLMAEKQSKR